MKNSSRKILVTCGLPYANGSIHIGHLVEYLQADFWTRFQKMRGNECHYICGDDTHGTPIMVEARKRNITPEQLIGQAWQEHTKDFADFQIQFSNYSSTNTPENKKLCEYFFQKMKDKNHINTKTINQLYCNHDKMFLPDRFVKGTCPKCGAKDQYGDSCDVCGATYTPADLKDSYCAICANPPVLKPSEQLLFKLNDHFDFLKAWLPEHLAKEMSNKMLEWFNEPLRDWDISRNAPYFGFEIPGYPDKFFYVWVDAPMGYVSATEQFCKAQGLNFDDFWKAGATSEVYHFIGKDIVYFHTLFWPALLKTADFRTPTQVFVHGHLTVNGEKMSKSKGTQITARQFLNNLDPMYLRYYYASKLSSTVDDIDLSLEDFSQRVNSDLIGKITNLASRGASMLGKNFAGKLVSWKGDTASETLLANMRAASESIAGHFEKRDFGKAVSAIRDLADEANVYFDQKAPWKSLATDRAATQKTLSVTVNAFRILAIYLKPVLPLYTQKVEQMFGEASYTWSDAQVDLKTPEIKAYEHLAGRIDPDKVKAMVEESKAAHAAKEAAAGPAKTAAAPVAAPADNGVLTIDDFMKVDLRVAQILEAEEIKEADKLLRLKVSLGSLGERQIIAGIKSAYTPEALKGRLVLVVANLAPRKMKFGMSEGMVLAAGPGGSEIFVLSPDQGAKPGDKVK